MIEETTTFANKIGELLAPVLIPMRLTGFFEAHVYMSVMTLLSVFLFIRLAQASRSNNTFDTHPFYKFRKLILVAYYTLCFIATNATAVAFKTLIIEEMDYETEVWFMHLVGPLHFFIVSVAAAFIWLIWRNRSSILDLMLCIYVQIGLLGGYYIGIYRLASEPFEITNPTTGMSGIFFILWFSILNMDLFTRFIRAVKTFQYSYKFSTDS